MLKKQLNIAPFLFILVFLLPSFMQLSHHHNELNLLVKSGRNIQTTQNKCAVCNFEFSVFSSPPENIVLQKDEPVINYCNNYSSVSPYYFSNYSFLLRAPPFKQV